MQRSLDLGNVQARDFATKLNYSLTQHVYKLALIDFDDYKKILAVTPRYFENGNPYSTLIFFLRCRLIDHLILSKPEFNDLIAALANTRFDEFRDTYKHMFTNKEDIYYTPLRHLVEHYLLPIPSSEIAPPCLTFTNYSPTAKYPTRQIYFLRNLLLLLDHGFFSHEHKIGLENYLAGLNTKYDPKQKNEFCDLFLLEQLNSHIKINVTVIDNALGDFHDERNIANLLSHAQLSLTSTLMDIYHFCPLANLDNIHTEYRAIALLTKLEAQRKELDLMQLYGLENHPFTLHHLPKHMTRDLYVSVKTDIARLIAIELIKHPEYKNVDAHRPEQLMNTIDIFSFTLKYNPTEENNFLMESILDNYLGRKPDSKPRTVVLEEHITLKVEEMENAYLARFAPVKTIKDFLLFLIQDTLEMLAVLAPKSLPAGCGLKIAQPNKESLQFALQKLVLVMNFADRLEENFAKLNERYLALAKKHHPEHLLLGKAVTEEFCQITNAFIVVKLYLVNLQLNPVNIYRFKFHDAGNHLAPTSSVNKGCSLS